MYRRNDERDLMSNELKSSNTRNIDQYKRIHEARDGYGMSSEALQRKIAIFVRPGKPGSILFAISERAYGNEASEAFLGNLREFKAQRTLDLTKAELPDLD